MENIILNQNKLIKENIIINKITYNTYISYYKQPKDELLISISLTPDECFKEIISDIFYNTLTKGLLVAEPDYNFSKYYKDLFFLVTDKNILKIRIPLYKGILKRFYDNYSDYYYLPEEDTCIYKTVASGVDKAYRQNAKKENCYTKHDGIFLPIYSNNENEDYISTVFFKEKYNSKIKYIAYNEKLLEESFFKNYIYSLLEYIMKIE